MKVHPQQQQKKLIVTSSYQSGRSNLHQFFDAAPFPNTIAEHCSARRRRTSSNVDMLLLGTESFANANTTSQDTGIHKRS
jgi:hypothetical protein